MRDAREYVVSTLIEPACALLTVMSMLRRQDERVRWFGRPA